jgi:hypothetical protein
MLPWAGKLGVRNLTWFAPKKWTGMAARRLGERFGEIGN